MRDMLSNAGEPAREAILPSGCNRDISEDMLVNGDERTQAECGRRRDVCLRSMLSLYDTALAGVNEID